MSNLIANPKFDSNQNSYHLNISLIEFKEDENTIIYSPALELSGYGNNPSEAKKSFSIALKEFIRYTFKKNTINELLLELGWTIKKTKHKFSIIPPLNSDLILKNTLYSDIVNNKNYKVFTESINLAIPI